MWVIFLLLAWAAAFLTCGRLCLAAAAAGRPPEHAPDAGQGRALTLYETAFLAGGPHRVTDLALVTMGRQRRLLLAHTGWATVVDPVGRDELERSVITAIGPEGQSPVPTVRTAHAAADAVRALADRLVAAGLAVPDPVRTNVSAAIRQVRGACALVVVAGAAAVLMVPPETPGRGQAAAWFALPWLLTAACLLIARIEVPPYTLWASPAGQELLERVAATSPRRTDREDSGAPDDTGFLTALAVRGRKAVADPELRAALCAHLRDHRY
ncbi:TIGR04222 domain-containing membrane protein [Streptomyces sp. ISL-11]|uniref:TIGR04222 domain-containing membrane protein n=1 Tax=Streptomyces sp. ISL-11 TaxID=2819174 RepID=UPI001BEBF129|nr:TIGR04222 domain-containing membrane protein [Streptomyces sp. ISL-11]MBT2382329.1 TIGR04222 domain-containing membrane protein [Streptomyces sp. ISL-11]